MAQSISLQGATYNDVPSVLLPKSGGGTASFVDVTDTTATAADVANTKYFYTAAGVRTLGTASGGGGGASNVVTGTFKGTTTGAAMDITLPYTGTGYPIAIIVFPTGGAYGNSTYNSLIQRYAFSEYCKFKSYANTEPTYQNAGNPNYADILYQYKSSTSGATQYSRSGAVKVNSYHDGNASAGQGAVVFRPNNKISVYISSGTDYGFAANIEYTYCVLYSS